MEFDVSYSERRFLIDAVDCYLDSFPEHAEKMGRFIDLLEHCATVGTTLHVNPSR